LTAQPRRAEILQKQYSHDLLVLEFSNTSPLWFETVKTGVPIRFIWKQNEHINTFFGYVSFISKSSSGQIENIMEVHSIGTTFPLKERTTKVFSNTTIPNAVKSIVEEYGFKFFGEAHDRVFDQLTIAGHSYWEWIQEQAKRIGYGVLVNGMEFYFRPLDKLIDQGVTSVPVLSLSGASTPINTQFLDRTLDSFTVLNGEYVEDPSRLRTTKQVGGVDPINATVITGKSSPNNVGDALRTSVSDVLFSEVRSEQVVHDYTSATSSSEGAATMARMNMPAKVKCQGDPRIRPFYPVLIQGTGPVTDGYWIPKEVKHMFARLGDYQIEMTVTSDGTGANNLTAKRQGTDTVVGMVDLNNAVENSGTNMNAPAIESVTLQVLNPLQSQTNQGFNRTPALWRYTSSKVTA
jgi:phage protein D